MTKKNPYEVIIKPHVSEKSMLQQSLKTGDSNPSLKKCESPKYVFLVNPKANKQEIATAVEEIYKNEEIKVVKVNTINLPAKARRFRGRLGFKSAFKKAIVTLRKDDTLDHA